MSSFGHHTVLEDLALCVPRGQTLAIIGESGCGKTVLLKAIIGLLRPTPRPRLFRRPGPGRFASNELTNAEHASDSSSNRRPFSTV